MSEQCPHGRLTRQVVGLRYDGRIAKCACCDNLFGSTRNPPLGLRQPEYCEQCLAKPKHPKERGAA